MERLIWGIAGKRPDSDSDSASDSKNAGGQSPVPQSSSASMGTE